jgi:hypothetical protein
VFAIGEVGGLPIGLAVDGVGVDPGAPATPFAAPLPAAAPVLVVEDGFTEVAPDPAVLETVTGVAGEFGFPPLLPSLEHAVIKMLAHPTTKKICRQGIIFNQPSRAPPEGRAGSSEPCGARLHAGLDGCT